MASLRLSPRAEPTRCATVLAAAGSLGSEERADVGKPVPCGDFPAERRPCSGGVACLGKVHAGAGAIEQAEDLRRPVARGAEPVRCAGVEVGDLARPENQIPVADDEADPPAEHVDPLGSVMRAPLAGTRLEGHHDLPRLYPAGVAAQRDHDAPVPAPRPQLHARIPELGGADEVVQAHPVHPGEREEQLEAGAPQAALEPRHGAGRRAGELRHLGEGEASARPDALQARSDPVQRGGEVCVRVHIDKDTRHLRFLQETLPGCPVRREP